MILLIDNYDSFSYNLVQLAGSIRPDIKVVRNDAMTVEEVEHLHPDHIILSPGPGYPKDAGICEDVVRTLKGKIPILGVCLGHQAICEAFGGTIAPAKKLMHGKQSRLRVVADSPLYQGMGEYLEAARYHSLVALNENFPKELEITAVDDENEIMAVQNQELKIYGLQFHPESILTPKGKILMENFLNIN